MNCEICNCANPSLAGESLCTYHMAKYQTLKATNLNHTSIMYQLNSDMEKIEEKHTAASFLQNALQHLQDRAATYDNPQGERSIGKTVDMFNTMTGHNLTEEQGWKFMALLKLVRSEQGEYKADSYEDGSAYIALAGESASQRKQAKS